MTSREEIGRHPSADELLDYFETKLSEDREHDLEEHLAACNDCAELGREVHAFHRLWQWPAAAHGTVYLRSVLTEAVGRAAAESTTASVRARLENWAKVWSGRAEAALQVITQASAEARRAAARTLAELARPGSSWAFQLEPAPTAVRGTARDNDSSVVLATALTPGKPRARVAVSAAEHGEIVVRLDGMAHEQAAPLVLLIAMSGAMTVRVAEAARQVGGDYRIARFTDVTPGEYLVAFEPMPDAD